MNWGGLSLGQAKLRILELEDELAAAGKRTVTRPAAVTKLSGAAPTPTVSIYHCEKPAQRGSIGQLIRSVMPHEPPGMRPGDIAGQLEGISSKTVGAFMHQWDDIGRTGEKGEYRYYLTSGQA